MSKASVIKVCTACIALYFAIALSLAKATLGYYVPMSLCHVSITVRSSNAKHVLLLYTADRFSWNYAHDYILQALHAVHNVQQQHVVALQAGAAIAATQQCAVCHYHFCVYDRKRSGRMPVLQV
jgi:hypothetical protein